MTHLLADGFLLFSHLFFQITIVILGCLFINRTLFFQVIWLSAMSIILNVALKGSFQMPLSPALHKIGYAFPSGHMQQATVFYGWLALNASSRWLKGLISLLLVGIGAALIHYGYHDMNDVLAGVFVALVILYCAHSLPYDNKAESLSRALAWDSIAKSILIASLLMLYSASLYLFIPLHAWIAYLTLFGLYFFRKPWHQKAHCCELAKSISRRLFKK